MWVYMCGWQVWPKLLHPLWLQAWRLQPCWRVLYLSWRICWILVSIFTTFTLDICLLVVQTFTPLWCVPWITKEPKQEFLESYKHPWIRAQPESWIHCFWGFCYPVFLRCLLNFWVNINIVAWVTQLSLVFETIHCFLAFERLWCKAGISENSLDTW